MKICLVTNTLTSGGAERVASVLANFWARGGHEVVLLVTYTGHRDIEYQLDPAVKVRFLLDSPRIRDRKSPSWPSRLTAFRQAIQDETPDTVISFLTNVNVNVLIAVFGLGIPTIISERVFPPLVGIPFVLHFARRILYPRADHVVMQTQEGLDWLNSHIPKSRGIVIPNPVEIPLQQEEIGIAPDEIVADEESLILAVGRLTAQKQLEKAIDAFACLAPSHPKARLVILGEGPLRDDLQNRIAAKGLSERISLPGRLDRMHDWHQRADCFVMTSGFEGFPNALLEAVCYGTPCLALDCKTGPRDILAGIPGNILLPLNSSAEAIAEGLSQLLAQESGRKSDEAVAAASLHSPERIADQWLQLANRAVKKDIGA